MTGLPVGIVVLVVVSVLIYFGLAHRVLDRMRLSDKAALVIVALLALGSFINVPIPGGRFDVTINVGGALVPIGVAVYLLIKAGTSKEWGRALIGALLTGGIIFGIGILGRGDGEPGGGVLGMLDALWFYPVLAGFIAYIFGRSRRGAFIAAILGLVLVDVAYLVWFMATGAPMGRVAIGGAGAFDGIVLSGIIAVLLAEIVGEARERMQGGPATEGRPEALLEGLRKPGWQDSNEDVTDEQNHTNHDQER